MAFYEVPLTNDKTGETVLIKSNDRRILDSKIQRRKAIWERQNQRLYLQEEKDHYIQEAEQLTEEAESEIENYNHILHQTLTVDDKIDLSQLKDTKPFRDYEALPEPERKIIPVSFLEIFSFFKRKKEAARALAGEEYQKALEDYEEGEKARKMEYEKEKSEYLQKQTTFNVALDLDKEKYEKGLAEGVIKYLGMVMERSKYPESLNVFPETHYEPNSKIVLVDMELPNYEDVPSIKEHKYVASRKEIEEIKMGNKEFEAFYNNLIYQITLRTIHEVFEADYAKVAELVVFNGWVEGVDGATGKDFKNCIVSIQVTRDEFEQLNLEKISPKECFQHLKGISAGSLINLAPVRPIMELNQEDKRFISAESVLDTLSQDTNLATMNWLQFEVLVRDLIEKEFSREGCKVEVTRASRDEGVDAVAFDQDPIRGGKYIIQAKRYNNLVPVSAVRDLYGTVHAEGAVKGILITTSYYGKESLEFVKDKPLKLINGQELIYMFNKHGYHYRIELTKKQKAASSNPY